MRGRENQDNRTPFYLKLRGLKKGETPHFLQETTKDHLNKIGDEPYDLKGNRVLLRNTINDVSGKMTGIKHFQDEYENEKYDVIKLTLIDGDERLIIQFNMSSFCRNMMNQLLSVDTIDKVRLMVWTYEDKTGITVWVDGEKSAWAHDWDEQKKMVKTIKKGGGKEEKDYFDLNQFFIGKVDEINGKITKLFESTPVSQDIEQKDNTSEVVATEDDDLPF